MNDEQLKNELQSAFDSAEGKPPLFKETWAAAETQHARNRQRNKAVAGLAAAAAVLAVTVLLWPAQQAEITDEFMIADSLLNSTSWFAPSDALLPEHQFDIYRDIPVLNGSTISREGTLL